MGLSTIYLFLFILLLVAATFIFFFYFLHKKSKAGIVISALLVLLFTSILGMNYIDQWTISKKDVVADFAFMDMEMKDDFEIIEMQVSGMPERNQETEIRVSNRDKAQMIDHIKSARDFKSLANISIYDNLQEEGSKRWSNFDKKDFFSREAWIYFNGVPTRILLSVYKEGNRVQYQRFEG
jgi:hypothetical protein